MRRDLPRLNSTVIEAYAAEPSRSHPEGGARRHQGAAAPFELRVMAAHGGTISIEAKELGRTLVSGPVGGVVGGQALAQRMGLRNVLCTDIGGTSFDIALITDGRFEITQTPDIARFVLNIPLVRIDSIGAGTGSFVRVNPNSNRPELGPDSAGSRIGVCWPEGGTDTVSVTDLNLVLGRLNPDYFLGGEVELDVELARAAIERQIARPLGLSVDAAAAGVIELFEQTLKNEAVGRILGKGYSPADYTLLCYGGGGPLHVAGYTEGVTYREVLVPAWAAGLLGLRLRLRRLRLPLRPDRRHAAAAAFGEAERAGIGAMITGAWLGLQDRVALGVREVGDRAREHPLHARRAHAVLRSAQRHRVRLSARRAAGRLAGRRSDRHLRGRLREDVRLLGALAGVRLPGHPRDRPRHGRRGEARAAAAARGAGQAARRRRSGRSTGAARVAIGSSRPRSSSSSPCRRATRSTARRSSSTRRPPSRSRRGAERGSTDIRSSTSPTWRAPAMATVEARSEPSRAGRRSAGMGRRLHEMLDGVRAPVRRHRPLLRSARARADGLGPDRLREALLPDPRGPRLGARDSAEHLGLADRARAGRAVLRPVHARGRLARAVHRDHRPRPHDVRRDQVDGPQRLRGQPRHQAGRHLRQQRPDDRRRAQRRRADVRADLLGGRADRLGGRGHPRPRHRREHAGRRSRSGRRCATRTASTCRA